MVLFFVLSRSCTAISIKGESLLVSAFFLNSNRRVRSFVLINASTASEMDEFSDWSLSKMSLIEDLSLVTIKGWIESVCPGPLDCAIAMGG